MVEQVGVEDQAQSGVAGADQVHFIGFDRGAAGHRRAQQRAELGRRPFTVAEGAQFDADHLCRVEPERGAEGSARGFHAQILVQQQQRRCRRDDERDPQTVGER
jgi:hypothetical protein